MQSYESNLLCSLHVQVVKEVKWTNEDHRNPRNSSQ